MVHLIAVYFFRKRSSCRMPKLSFQHSSVLPLSRYIFSSLFSSSFSHSLFFLFFLILFSHSFLILFFTVSRFPLLSHSLALISPPQPNRVVSYEARCIGLRRISRKISLYCIVYSSHCLKVYFIHRECICGSNFIR
jgi:hypothetical protein